MNIRRIGSIIFAIAVAVAGLGRLGVTPVAHAAGITSIPGVGLEITSLGPINDIIVAKDTTIQEQDSAFSPTADCSSQSPTVCGETFPSESLVDKCSADSGLWVAVGILLFGPDMSDSTVHCDSTATSSLTPDTTYTPVSQTSSGDGSSGNPFTVVTTVQLTATLNLVETVQYVVGSVAFQVRAQLLSTVLPLTGTIFFGSDIFLAENDNGFSYFVPKTGDPNSNGQNVQVGGLNAVDQQGKTADVCSVPTGGTGPIVAGTFHEFLAPDASAGFYVEDNFDTVWSNIDSAAHTLGGHLPNTVLPSTTCDDNGAAVEWDSVASGTTVRMNLAFGNVTMTPAYVSGFSASRHQNTVVFHWRTVIPTQLAGFGLYARSHRLNARIIPVHRNRSYIARAHWSGPGPFSLHIALRSGGQIVVTAH